jgi:hypothetical protein
LIWRLINHLLQLTLGAVRMLVAERGDVSFQRGANLVLSVGDRAALIGERGDAGDQRGYQNRAGGRGAHGGAEVGAARERPDSALISVRDTKTGRRFGRRGIGRRQPMRKRPGTNRRMLDVASASRRRRMIPDGSGRSLIKSSVRRTS